MRQTRALACVLLLGLVLAACQNTSAVNPRWNLVSRLTEEFPDIEVRRSSAMVLPASATVVVVVRAEARAEVEQALIARARAWVASRQGAITVAEEPLLEDEAGAFAREHEADFLLMLRIVHWPAEAPSPTSCPHETHPSCKRTEGDTGMRVSLRVDDLGAGRVVDTLSVENPPGIAWDEPARLAVLGNATERLFRAILP